MKLRKIAALIIIIIICLAAVISLIAHSSIISKKMIEMKFNKNESCFSTIANYLNDLQFETIRITVTGIENSDSTVNMFAGIENGDVPIEDEAVNDALKRLAEKKACKIIEKNEHAVSFLFFNRSTDFGNGAVYSADGGEPELQFLTYLEPLSVKGWYYYEEDFNEYKSKAE